MLTVTVMVAIIVIVGRKRGEARRGEARRGEARLGCIVCACVYELENDGDFDDLVDCFILS